MMGCWLDSFEDEGVSDGLLRTRQSVPEIGAISLLVEGVFKFSTKTQISGFRRDVVETFYGTTLLSG